MLPVKMDATISCPVPAVTSQRGQWGHRRVTCTTTDVSMAGASGACASLAERKVSLDSGIGSTNSIDLVAHKDLRLVARNLERTYRELVACPAQLKYLGATRQAIARQAMGAFGLSQLTMIEAIVEILSWCELVAVPLTPPHLVRMLRQSQRMRRQSNELTWRVDRKCTAGNLKKAIKKNEQLTQFNLHRLRPAQLDYDRVLYALIDQQPAMHELSSCSQSLKAMLPESMDVNAPIDVAVRAWAYNVLLERARAAAGFHY